MPAPRKYPQELRDRAQRLVVEARQQDPGLSLNQAVKRIGERVGVNPDTLCGWRKQAAIDAGELPGTTTSDAKRITARRPSVFHDRNLGRGLAGTRKMWRLLARQVLKQVVAAAAVLPRQSRVELPREERAGRPPYWRCYAGMLALTKVRQLSKDSTHRTLCRMRLLSVSDIYRVCCRGLTTPRGCRSCRGRADLPRAQRAWRADRPVGRSAAVVSATSMSKLATTLARLMTC